MGLEPDLSGEVLAGRYRLEEVLGTGGMATVHRAVDTQLDRPVAVKLLRLTTADDSDQDRRRRAGREARTLATLDHPALVALYDAHFAEGSDEPSFLVMEYVHGRTLADHLRDGPLPVDAVARIGRHLAAGLHVVHERGIVHRDIKPSNVLVDGDPRTAHSTVKITDFGIAVADGATRVTTPGALIGTAAYLSPEQVRGLSVTPAADIYALGLLLIELITGQIAYPGTWLESALARLNAPVGIPEHLDPEFGDLLRAMTAIDPSQRPTARTVQDQLSSRTATTAAAAPVTAVRAAPAVPSRPAAAQAPRRPATSPANPRGTRRAHGVRKVLLRAAAATPAAALVITLGLILTAPESSSTAATAASETSDRAGGTPTAGTDGSRQKARRVTDSSAKLGSTSLTSSTTHSAKRSDPKAVEASRHRVRPTPGVGAPAALGQTPASSAAVTGTPAPSSGGTSPSAAPSDGTPSDHPSSSGAGKAPAKPHPTPPAKAPGHDKTPGAQDSATPQDQQPPATKAHHPADPHGKKSVQPPSEQTGPGEPSPSAQDPDNSGNETA